MHTYRSSHEKKWIGKLWISYWVIIAVHALAQLLSYWFLPYDAHPVEFYVHMLAKPTAWMAGTLVISWVLHRWKPRYSHYAILLTGTFIAMMLIQSNSDIRMASALFLLPILVSVMFFRYRLTLFTAALQLISFILIYMRDGIYRSHLTPFDLIAIPSFVLICTWICGIIMIRGREVLGELHVTLTDKKVLIERNLQMDKLSKTDALTGLRNHIAFHEQFDQAIENAIGGEPFHLALIDIDNFKKINDTYGHRVGDIILARVSRVIREQLAPSDVGARYGGEEFALLLFEQSFEEAYRLVEKIRHRISLLPHEELGGKHVTVSVGLHSYARELTKEQLFETVDAYLYQAKRGGKNRTVVAG